MKMKKTLIIMGASVLVLGLAAALILPKIKPASQNTDPNQAQLEQDRKKLELVRRDPAEVSEIDFKRDDFDMTLYRSSDTYLVKGFESVALDANAVQTVVNDLSNLVGETLISENGENMEEYGLNDPVCTTTVKFTDGTQTVLYLGNVAPDGNTYYMMRDEDKRIVKGWTNYAVAMLSSVDSFLSKPDITLSFYNITYMRLEKDGEVKWELQKGNRNERLGVFEWDMVAPWKRQANYGNMLNMKDQLSALVLDSVVVSNPSNLADYGLDHPSAVFDVKSSDKDYTLLFGSAANTSFTYVMEKGGNVVYKIANDLTSFLLNATTKDMMMDMAVMVDIRLVDAVEYTSATQHGIMNIANSPSYDTNGKVRIDSNDEYIYDQTFTMDGVVKDDKASRTWYTACIGQFTNGVTEENWTLPPNAQPVATIKYYRQNDPKELVIQFYPYDRDYYAISINGEVNFIIRKETVDQLDSEFQTFKDSPAATATPAAATPAAVATPTPAKQ